MAVQSGGFSFNIASVGGYWSWTVLANNIQGLGQRYQVIDINTPYGRLIDAAIPIPGDVITAMSDSIAEMQQQLAAAVSLVTGTPSSYSLTVTEGEAASIIASVPFTNSGAFGSFLSVSSTPGSPWITANPTSTIGVGKNQQAQISIGILPTTMLATSSPYSGSVIIQDSNSPSSITLSVNATVLPRPQISLSTPTINLSYSITSGIPSGSQQCVVSNSGLSGSVLNYTASKIQNQSPWLTFTPISGGPLSSGGTDPITFSLITGNVPLIAGIYTEIVSVISGNAPNSPQNITITLTVTP